MLKMGIAGLGKMGQIRAAEIAKSKTSELKAVFDINPNASVGSAVECRTFDELLEQDIDAVFISTYNYCAAEYTIQALKRGKHVFCEKPPAINVAQLQKVVEAEQQTGLVLKYGLNHRFHYSVMEAKKRIDRNDLGRILWMRGVYGKAGSIDYDKNWRNYKQYSGGGILIDQGLHMLDLMLHFSGKPFTKVNSFVTTLFWNIEAEDNAFAIMQTDDQVTAMLHSSATQWRHKFLLEICCENGYINLDGILSSTRSYAPEKLVIGYREFEDVTHAMGKPREETIWFEYDDSWKLELADFEQAIQQKTSVTHGSSREAMEALALVEKIYERSSMSE
ncbi:Gfo/Idh/MocA family protein [Chrysiogenes arsenatis]|uniref:Gfo/Idh/MocA family protein n=1 Tax=Chrysiogenes arsenatis TaxID=309797 RepID=UPI00042A760A|nr:Gfo/Idh/MocA family oxidoreductase [Chrysiogenes arsenatis]